MKLSRIGEFELINRIRQILGNGNCDVILGIGDDAAVLRTSTASLMVLTTDALVEGTHFDLKYTPIESLGWKALAINLSDIAAMGGMPKYCVVSLALPESWLLENVELIYKGLKRCSKTYCCSIVGGDTVRSCEHCFISVTVVGEVEEDCIVRRSGSKIGDLICVTGDLGGSRVGLEVLTSGENKNRFPVSVNRFLEPNVRLQEARRLISDMGISSMIDISDGLSSEINHICRESDLGCRIWEEKIPVAGEAIRWAKEKDVPLSVYKLESGEEYELLFTVEKARYEKWQSQKADLKNVKITVVGEMVQKKEGIRIMRDGKDFPLTCKGWDHFKK